MNRDIAQCRIKPSRHGAGTNIQGHKGKERFHVNHEHFRLREEESEHEHDHASTSEDDRFDKRANIDRTTPSSGLLCESVIARITIDEKTGHIMSL